MKPMNRPHQLILAGSLLVFLPACSVVQHKHKHNSDVVRVRPASIPAGTTLPTSEAEAVRNAEVIKEYYAGAYIDPNNPNVRHNPHSLQRVEQSAGWNTDPNVPVVAGGPTYIAATAAAQKNAISAQLSGELDRQKGYTQALVEQNEKLQQIIEQMNAAKEKDAEAKAATQSELKLTNDTLRSLHKELQKAPAASSLSAPEKKPSLFDSLGTEEAAPPSNSMLTPAAKDLLDTIGLHITALEGNKSSKLTEDIIELDSLYAPLVAKGEK
jgi:hypothetical protein